MSNSAAKPLVVLQDEHGDLFLGGPPNEFHREVMLDDHSIWDAYVKACNEMKKAQVRVESYLRCPSAKEIKP